MVFPFSKKKTEPERVYIPADVVQRYASQGMSEAEIASRLERQGFAPPQISQALRIALKQEVAPSPEMMGPTIERHPPEFRAPERRQEEFRRPPERAPEEYGNQPIETPTMEMGPAPRREFPQRETAPSLSEERSFAPPERITMPGQARPRIFEEAPQQMPQQRVPEIPEADVTLEEIIEGIIAEKWYEFEDRLGGFEKRDVQLQNEIEDLRKKIGDVEKMQKERETTLLSKFESFGDSMEGIQGRIGSIEKVFKEFLPELTQNIRVMSDLIETAKKK